MMRIWIRSSVLRIKRSLLLLKAKAKPKPKVRAKRLRRALRNSLIR
jgi:hypothetical protein